MSPPPVAGRRLHFVGIGGAGMSGLALVARELGAEVTGSDRAESSYTARLREPGSSRAIGHDAREPARRTPRSWCPRRSPRTTPELAAARAAGADVLHRGELLGEVARSSGRSPWPAPTARPPPAAMAAHALLDAGRDPAFLVGGELRALGTNAGLGRGRVVVVEADESDRSFLKLARDVAVVTNVELDHHATYRSLAELERAFAEFAAPARAARSPGRAWRLRRRADLRDRRRRPARRGASSCCRWARASRWRACAWSCGARAPQRAERARGAGGLPRGRACEPAEAAPGARALHRARAAASRTTARRPPGARVFDDYAHHPTEVRATLEAARTLGAAPAGRLLPAAPLLAHAPARARVRRALALADVVVVLDVYPARERAEDFPGVSGLLVAGAAADAAGGPAGAGGCRASTTPSACCASELREGDVLLTMGAGDVDELARRRLSARERCPPRASSATIPLARLTTVRTGGRADWFARPDTSRALVELLAWADDRGAAR